jgi:hypothetical protein
MKILPLIFVLIPILFAGCKEEEKPEPEEKEPKTVYAPWRMVPDSVVNTKNKGIEALQLSNDILHIHTEDKYYALDTTLIFLDAKPMATDFSWLQVWAPKYGENYSITQVDGLTFRITDNLQVTNSTSTYILDKRMFDPTVEVAHCSDITPDNRFFTVTTPGKYDSIRAVLQEWQISHTPGADEPMELLELKRFTIDSSKSPDLSSGPLKVFSFGNRILVNNAVNVTVIENEEILSQFVFSFENLININGIIYGGGEDRAYIIDRDKDGKKGLIKSVDGGLTWEVINTDRSLSRLNFKQIDGQVFAYGQGGFGIMSDDFTKVLPVDTEGLFDMPRNLAKVGQWAIVGTDVGLYYKSWDSFLNK